MDRYRVSGDSFSSGLGLSAFRGTIYVAGWFERFRALRSEWNEAGGEGIEKRYVMGLIQEFCRESMNGIGPVAVE